MIRHFARCTRWLANSKQVNWFWLAEIVVLQFSVFLLLPPHVHADDCSIDPTRAEDCLRTPGFAENVGTAVAVIGTILVNGVAIQTIILQPGRPRSADDEDGEDGDNQPLTYTLNIRTEGGRTSIQPDGKETLWIYATVSCSDPKVDCSGFTAAVSFTPSGQNADWLQVLASSADAGFSAVQLAATNPQPQVPLASASAAIIVSASVGVGTLSTTLPLTFPLLQASWEVLLRPEGQKELMADSKQVMTLFARIKFDQSLFADAAELQRVTEETKASIHFASSTDWVAVDEPPLDGGEDRAATNLEAANPTHNAGAATGPDSCTITITGSFMGTPMPPEKVVLPIAALPALELRPQKVELLAGSSASVDVAAIITTPGPGKWSFEATPAQNSAGLLRADVEQTTNSSATITVHDAGGTPTAGSAKTYCSVNVKAQDDVLGIPLECLLYVSLCQEGLIIVRGSTDGQMHVRADGKQQKTEIDFCAYVFDAESGGLRADAAAIQSLTIDLEEEQKSPGANVASACQVQHEITQFTSTDTPSARVAWWAEKEIPGDERVTVRYRVSIPELDPEKFSRVFNAVIEPMTMEEESAAKDVEIKRCQELIEKYVPAGHKTKFYQLLDKNKEMLGPKGLAELRRKLWKIAAGLILAEGAEGYESEAAWADRIVSVLEVAEWAGNIAFNAAAMALCGPYGQIAAPMVKDFIVSAINCYQQGQSFEDWASQNLWVVLGAVEGQVMDIDRLSKLTGGSRTKAWAIFVGYTFGKKLVMGKDIVEAAKETAEEIGTMQFTAWLGEKAKASYQAHGAFGHKPAETPAAPHAGPEDGEHQPTKHADEPTGNKHDQEGVKPTEEGTSKQGEEPTAKHPEEEGSTGRRPAEPEPQKGKAEPEASKPEEGARPTEPEGGVQTHEPQPHEPGTQKTGSHEPATHEPEGHKPEKAPEEASGEQRPGERETTPEDPNGGNRPEGTEPEGDVPPDREQAWQQGREQGRQAIHDFAEALKSGDQDQIRQQALGFFSNKNAMMELNRTPNAGYLRAKLNETMRGVYRTTDAGMRNDLADQYGVPADHIRVFNASNPKRPSGTTKSSYDRDITAQRLARQGEWVRDPNANGGFRQVRAGEQTWIDIPARTTEGAYADHFYRAATGHEPPSYEEAVAYTRQHDQTCTDRLSGDSYGNNRRDLDTALTRPGRDFSDPQQIGEAMGYKADEWFEHARRIEATDPAAAEGMRAEGMRQTSKQYDNQITERVKALREQGVEVKTDVRLEAAMRELKKVEAGTQSPVATEAKLRELGYESPSQVAHDSGTYLEMLQKLRPKNT